MKLSLAELELATRIDCLIVHSLENSLYQASVRLGTEEYWVTDGDGRILKHRNKADLLARFAKCLARALIGRAVLRHSSAYDEMIGQPFREQANTLEVPLSLELAGAERANPFADGARQ